MFLELFSVIQGKALDSETSNFQNPLLRNFLKKKNRKKFFVHLTGKWVSQSIELTVSKAKQLKFIAN